MAYGELWVDAGEREVELARLLVAPAHRGRGIGRRLTRLLVERARRIHPRVFPRVHADHTAALRCFAAAGIRRVSAAEEARWNRDQPIPYAWMVHRP